MLPTPTKKYLKMFNEPFSLVLYSKKVSFFYVVDDYYFM